MSEPTKTLTIRIPSQDYEALQKLSDDRSDETGLPVSMGSIVREMVTDHFKTNVRMKPYQLTASMCVKMPHVEKLMREMVMKLIDENDATILQIINEVNTVALAHEDMDKLRTLAKQRSQETGTEVTFSDLVRELIAEKVDADGKVVVDLDGRAIFERIKPELLKMLQGYGTGLGTMS